MTLFTGFIELTVMINNDAIPESIVSKISDNNLSKSADAVSSKDPIVDHEEAAVSKPVAFPLVNLPLAYLQVKSIECKHIKKVETWGENDLFVKVSTFRCKFRLLLYI